MFPRRAKFHLGFENVLFDTKIAKSGIPHWLMLFQKKEKWELGPTKLCR